jgi:hypothetical protein
MAYDSEVLGGVALSCTRLIFAKRDVQTPVQTILETVAFEIHALKSDPAHVGWTGPKQPHGPNKFRCLCVWVVNANLDQTPRDIWGRVHVTITPDFDIDDSAIRGPLKTTCGTPQVRASDSLTLRPCFGVGPR